MGKKKYAMFPSKDKIMEEYLRNAYLIDMGKKHMVKTRGEKWFNFFMWLPVVGNMVFLKEGKKAEKEQKALHAGKGKKK